MAKLAGKASVPPAKAVPTGAPVKGMATPGAQKHPWRVAPSQTPNRGPGDESTSPFGRMLQDLPDESGGHLRSFHVGEKY